MIDEIRCKHRKQLVLGAFSIRFHRQPQERDVNYWVGFLQQGNTLRDMLVAMVAMAKSCKSIEEVFSEYEIASTDKSLDRYLHLEIVKDYSNLSNVYFIESIYYRLLGQYSDIDGRDRLLVALANSTSRLTLVQDMYASPEAVLHRDNLIRLNLKRQPNVGNLIDTVHLTTHAARIYEHLVRAIGMSAGWGGYANSH